LIDILKDQYALFYITGEILTSVFRTFVMKFKMNTLP